jgi:uncharacterized protein (TIGR02266 family)
MDVAERAHCMSDYWISDAQGRVLGPIGLEVLRHLVQAGRLRDLTEASRDGRHFAELRSFPEVANLIAEASTTHREEQDKQEALRLVEELQTLRGKQVHEVFGLPEDASIDAFRASFFSMVKRFYPARLPQETHEELRQAYAAMFHFLSRLMEQIEHRAVPPAPPLPARASPGRPLMLTPPPPKARPTYHLQEFVGWERRDDNRVYADLRITLQSVGLLTEQQAVNISNGGVFLATQRMIPLGERLELTLHFDDPPRDIKARGMVVWQNEDPAPSQPRGVGVRFTQLDAEDCRFISYYIKKAQLRAAAVGAS